MFVCVCVCVCACIWKSCEIVQSVGIANFRTGVEGCVHVSRGLSDTLLCIMGLAHVSNEQSHLQSFMNLPGIMNLQGLSAVGAEM